MASLTENTHQPDQIYIYDDEKTQSLFQGITLASIDAEQQTNEISEACVSPSKALDEIALENLSVSDCMTCITCNYSFEDRFSQVSHYRSDWHRFNIKQKLKGGIGIPEDKFEEITGDISSISGSGSDSDEENQEKSLNLKETLTHEEVDNASFHIEGIGRRNPRVFLRNVEGHLFSIYRCVLYGKKNGPESVGELISMVNKIPKQLKWVVLMLAGGHFAAAVFDGDKIVVHKTIHRYVVRAKGGTAQSTHDKQGGHAKSVGAFMRRHHEAALLDDIKQLLQEWSEHMKGCDRIFLRATGSNRTTLFGGKNSALDKNDIRVRIIPFPTRRPTFNEVKRAHNSLSTIHCHGVEADFMDHIARGSPKKMKRVEMGQEKIVKKKSNTESMRQKSPVRSKHQDLEDSSSDSECEFVYSEHVTNTIDDLQQFECAKKSRKKNNKKKKQPDKEKTVEAIDEGKNASDVICESVDSEQPLVLPEKVQQDMFHGLRNELYTAVKTGNCDALNDLIQQLRLRCDEDLPVQVVLNEPISKKDGSTLLHIGSTSGHPTIVRNLLSAGADPTVRDNSGQFVYVITQDKECRNEFRRFMADFPEKYNYSVAQIPCPLTKEMEDEKRAKEAEKRKVQRKAKREKTKVKKAEEDIIKADKMEKSRFLNLSDREKRALAAERRLVSQYVEKKQVIPALSRCFTCGADMTGKLPFEYSDNIFCTSKCLQTHRKNSAVSRR